MAHRVLGGDLALAERGVRELPAAGDVAGGEDRRDRGAHVVVGRDAGARIGGDADLVEPEALDERRPADRHEHQVGLDRLAVAVAHDQLLAGVLDARALLLEQHRDATLLERLLQLLGRIRVLLRE